MESRGTVVAAGALVLAVASALFAAEVPGHDAGPGGGVGDGPRPVVPAAHHAGKSGVRVRRARLAELDAAAAEHTGLRGGEVQRHRVGVIRRLRPLRAPRRVRAGQTAVTELPDGSLVWSAEIASPGATGLRVRFDRFDLPAGAEVVCYDAADATEGFGPWSKRGPGGRGGFLSPTVFADTVRVELRVPHEAARQSVRLEIDAVAHRYVADPFREDRAATPGPRKAGGCNNHIACDPDYAAAVGRAVAVIETSTFEGVFACTGTLLADSDPDSDIPWFLTANHCVSTEFEAENSEFFWDFRAGTCNGAPPSIFESPRSLGATLATTSSSTDMTLLRITGALPENRSFAGWTTRMPAEGDRVVGVHHPGGGAMRVSYGRLRPPGGNFHDVTWRDGVTAQGSSGSALFDAQKRVIGQLYGGSSSCSNPRGVDTYGRIDRSYPRLAPFLGSGGGGSGGDAWDPVDDVVAGASAVGAPPRRGLVHGPHFLGAGDTADWFVAQLALGARYRFFSEGLDDVRVDVFRDVGTQFVASDDDSGGGRQFSLDLTAAWTGPAYLRVATSGAAAAADYSLHAVAVDVGAPRPPAPPSHVRAAADASGLVTLRWRDRSRDEVGWYVERLVASVWTRVGEAARNSRRFQEGPGAGGHLYRVGAWNAAGVTWREAQVQVVNLDTFDGWDPADDVPGGATTLTPPSGGTSPEHTLSRSDVVDWYRIELDAGITYTFESSGQGDPLAALYEDSSDQVPAAIDDDSGPGRNFRIVFTPAVRGTWWLRVSPWTEGEAVRYAVSWK